MQSADESERAAAVDEVLTAGERVALYRLLAHLLSDAPGSGELARIGRLPRGQGALGHAIADLSEAAKRTGPAVVAREFHRLFIGVGRGELLPYASYYIAGSLHDRPLVRLREDMQRLGIARADGIAEPEDHIATLLEIMAGLIDGGLPASPGAAERFLHRHLARWARRFFADLAAITDARFYSAAGRLGTSFLDAEMAAARRT